jgi:hypothetical protein
MIFMIVNSVLHQNTDQEWSSDSTLHTYAIPLLFLIDIDIQMTYSMFWLILTYKWHTLCFDWYWHINDILYVLIDIDIQMTYFIGVIDIDIQMTYSIDLIDIDIQLQMT